MSSILTEDSKQYLDTLYKAFAKHYHENTDVWSNDSEMRSTPAIIQGQLKLPDTIHALDIGCGAGLDTEYFSQIYATATGIDLHKHNNWDFITKANKNIEFYAMDFLSFKPKRKYHLILDNGCFHHQHPDSYQLYLNRIANLLAQRSYLILSTFKNNELSELIDSNGRLHKYFTDKELRQHFTNAGYQLVQEFDIYRKRHNDYYRLSILTV